jgi:ribosome maturation factor RimP
MIESTELSQYIESLLQGIGIELVSLRVGKRDRLPSYKLVIYNRQGTGIEECTRSHRLLQSSFEEHFGHDNFYIEVASPGIDWAFSSLNDYRIFSGRGINLTLSDGTQTGGILEKSDEKTVWISTPQGNQEIPFDNISGCKLDFSREGK